MDQEKATELMLQTCKVPPYLRIAAHSLDLHKEAFPVASTLLSIIGGDFDWRWPNTGKYCVSRNANREASERPKFSDEERHGRPELAAEDHFLWLFCAIVASNTLDYLQRCENDNIKLYGKTLNEKYSYAFCPKDFYQYTWICLNQGRGTDIWATPPPECSTPEFGVMARKYVADAVIRWENGEELDSMYPGPALPGPGDQEDTSRV